jgi:3-methyladenine DNA glycosylase/8-oxoguanine DNA glycosylase
VPFGLYDPTCRRAPGVLWKAGRTPEGPATLRLRLVSRGVHASAWGPGAEWALDRAAALAGLHDVPGELNSPGPLGPLAARLRGVRLPRSAWVLDGLTEYILQQRVSFRDAARSHRRLLATGEEAPGPPGLTLPLSAADWLRLRDGALRLAGVDGRRAAALRSAAREARRVEGVFALDDAAARQVLASVRGCGPWTVEITMGFVLGCPDAVPVGDLHLPHEVAWALAGERRADDSRMLELLSPWRGQRFRVLRLLLAAGRLHLGRATRGSRAPR